MVQYVTLAAAWDATMSKAFMLAFALSAAAIGLGLVGSNYMKALGRNPEAGKAAGQVVIIAAMIEVTALLAFLLGAFLLG
jgi:F0F1-type ATP synthase membrane subunit c/vacuolar-type H+-ATPase subunit K